MKPATLRIGVFLLTFAASVCAIALYRGYTQRSPRLLHDISYGSSLSNSNLVLTPDDCEPQAKCVNSLQFPDGKSLMEGIYCEESSAEMDYSLRQMLIPTSPVDQDGSVTEEFNLAHFRWVRVYPRSGSEEKTFSILHRHQAVARCYYFISTRSLKLALDFEQQQSKLFRTYLRWADMQIPVSRSIRPKAVKKS